MAVLPAPDFPTGGRPGLLGGDPGGVPTGAGPCGSGGRPRSGSATAAPEIVITEIPYEVNKASLLELIADLVKTKRIDGITDLRDESDRDGTSVVLELRRDAPAEIVLNRIYEHTPLETSFGVINLCLVDQRRRRSSRSGTSWSCTSPTGGRRSLGGPRSISRRPRSAATSSRGSSPPSTTSTR